MKLAEQLIVMISEAMAKTADACADQLEADKSELPSWQALRNFAAAIRSTNREHETEDETVH